MAPRCAACGDPPTIDGRFAVTARIRDDRRGRLFDGFDGFDGERSVRVRVCAAPADDAAAPTWRAAAEVWLAGALPWMAAPVAWGTLPDGRWYRVERPVTGQPLRAGAGRASVLGVVATLLERLIALHAAGISHGGISMQTVLRREDGSLALVDFGPDARTPADDVHDVAQLANVLSKDLFGADLTALFRRMRAADPAARPTASEALTQLRAARLKRRPPPVAPAGTGGSSRVPLLILLAFVACAWFWYDSRGGGADFWQGELTGKVWNTIGDAPVARQRECRIAVTAAEHGRNNCHVHVECGGTIIYGDGDGGYARCAGSPVRAIDSQTSAQDTDPRLELAMDRGRLEVSDLRHEEWSVMIGLNLDSYEE